MKDFWSRFYLKRYSRFKKLPLIAAIVEMATAFVSWIIALIVSIMEEVPEVAIPLLIFGWMAIILTGALTFLFLSLIISPTVARTDAVLNIEKKLSALESKDPKEANTVAQAPVANTPESQNTVQNGDFISRAEPDNISRVTNVAEDIKTEPAKSQPGEEFGSFENLFEDEGKGEASEFDEESDYRCPDCWTWVKYGEPFCPQCYRKIKW